MPASRGRCLTPIIGPTPCSPRITVTAVGRDGDGCVPEPHGGRGGVWHLVVRRARTAPPSGAAADLCAIHRSRRVRRTARISDQRIRPLATLAVRGRLRAHAANATCNACPRITWCVLDNPGRCAQNEVMLTPLSRPLVAALSMLVLVSGSAAAAANTRPPVAPTLRAVPGSALPALRGAARLAPTAAARPIDVTVSLKPRNASLLAYSARTSSGSKPMTTAELRSLFAPSQADRAAVLAYMRGQGLHLERSGLLTLSFHGSAAAASRAFHVVLSTYRGADGHVFRAPDAAVRLPAAITPVVSSVTGLDTATKLHSVATGPELTPQTTVPAPCTAASRAKHFYGGYLPGDLATAYGHRSLIQNGYDGTGESIALVEFTNFKASDISAFKSCFGLTTPVHTRPINGGSSTMSGAIEAELDIEVALSNAPHLSSVEVYTAPNSIAQILPMVDRMISTKDTTNTFIVSDSWGLCEDALPPSFLQAES